MKLRRLLSVFLLAALLCGLFTVPAAALEDPDIRAKAALLVEAETGTILYDKNAHDDGVHRPRRPACHQRVGQSRRLQARVFVVQQFFGLVYDHQLECASKGDANRKL